MLIVRPLVWLALALTLLGAQVACAIRSEPSTQGYPGNPVSAGAPPIPEHGTPTAVAPTPPPRRLPTLDREPTVGVLLSDGPEVVFTLLRPARASGQALASGEYRASIGNGQVLVNGSPFGSAPLIIAQDDASRPGFSATLTPPFGKPQRLQFAGTAVLAASKRGVALIERLPLERYLAGVVGAEMTPTWPLEALKAQAIAARSYAAARWMARSELPWQLHWHYAVDMAYAGVPSKAQPQVVQAVAQTRGQVLMYQNLPVPALFHASSGGRTEAADNLWSGLKGADGRTVMTPVMPSVDDPAAEAGCAGLRQVATHWRWKSDIPMSQITRALQGWSREAADRPRFGVVTEVRPDQRFADSGRVQSLAITHKRDGRSRTDSMSAQAFRLAVSPLDIPSTWWDRCVTAKAKGGTLVLAGRGFGHGVGLSQVSAWQLAKQGVAAARIVAVFYPGAVLSACYR